MKILVTGATGRIGHNFVDELLKHGHEVRALVMPGDPQRGRVEKPGVEIVEGALTDQASLAPAVAGVDAIYHLGALMPQGRKADELFQVNVGGTFNLLEAALPHADRLKRFVMASTDNVYWNRNGALYLPIDENHPRINDDPYGISKILCEDLCWGYMRRAGLQVTIPRFCVTLEPHELLDPDGILGSRFFLKHRLAMLEAMPSKDAVVKKAIETLKAGDQGHPTLVLARDPQGLPGMEPVNDPRNLAEGLLLLLENPSVVGETFHLMAPHSYTYDQYVPYVAKLTGWPVVEVTVPSVMRWELSIAKARAMLGYNPTRGVFQMLDEGWEATKSRFGK